jgi:hypothetical protein
VQQYFSTPCVADSFDPLAYWKGNQRIFPELAKDIVDILLLAPFEWATMMTQGDNIVTTSAIVPLIRGVGNDVGKLAEKFHSKMTQTLKDQLVHSFRSTRPDKCSSGNGFSHYTLNCRRQLIQTSTEEEDFMSLFDLH